ncbi:MAG: ABC transporter permease [Sarcina sp.]|nr:ABC transporter permease [Sarcina sp.]
MWEKMFTYIVTHGDALLIQTATHLWISLAALTAAILVGVPCGYLAADLPGCEKWISAPFQVLRVIPSLAILVLLIPGAGTGALPAVIALTILAVPPVLLNTIVGFRDVPAFMTESAAGMGMTDREILWNVRIPLALPLIFAGIRTALVEVIASAALAARIGAGGLGEVIFTGLGLNRMDLLLLGGVLVAALSLLCGGLFDALTRHVLRYKYL